MVFLREIIGLWNLFKLLSIHMNSEYQVVATVLFKSRPLTVSTPSNLKKYSKLIHDGTHFSEMWFIHRRILFFFCPCHVACKMLVSPPRIEPVSPLYWEHRVWTTGLPGKSQEFFFFSGFLTVKMTLDFPQWLDNGKKKWSQISFSLIFSFSLCISPFTRAVGK